MIPNVPNERCEAHALALSAFLDGELPFPDCLPAVDHLASCDECRRHYLGARRLSERLVEAPAAPAPESAWDRIERAEGSLLPRRASRRFPAWTLRAAGLAAAAVLVVAIGVARFRAPSPPAGSDPASAATPREIVVQGARGRMTDDRFLALLTELLSADSRYHRETERVLRFVLRREGRSAFDDPAAPTTESPEPEEGEGGDAPRSVRTPAPLAS